MPTSLVTGAAGFIGSHVCDSLLTLGHKVIGLDDLSGGFMDNVPAGVEFIQGSILDRGLLHEIFLRDKPDYVYHLAAYAAEGLSHFIKHYNYTNNLIGSVNLINGSVNTGVKCFVFTSSIAVYGSQQTPFTEDMLPQPEDPYGIAKYAVEQELRATHEMFGLPYIIFRPHNVYGERQNIGDRYRNVVGIFMNQCLKGEPMTIFGDGLQQRSFTYINEVAPYIARSVQFPRAQNQVFNIGGAEAPISVLRLADLVAASMNVPTKIKHLPFRREVYTAFSSHQKFEQVFRVPVDTSALGNGLLNTAAWVKQHGARITAPFARIEIEKGLPESWK